jgi:hypothetical protein
MDEQEFDTLTRLRPFGTADFLRAEAQARRGTALGMALWGKNPDDLQRQLLAPHPEIPAGFDLADFRELQKSLWKLAAGLNNPRLQRLSSSVRAYCSSIIVVGTQRLTALEARCEIVRRAIEHLENR